MDELLSEMALQRNGMSLMHAVCCETHCETHEVAMQPGAAYLELMHTWSSQFTSALTVYKCRTKEDEQTGDRPSARGRALERGTNVGESFEVWHVVGSSPGWAVRAQVPNCVHRFLRLVAGSGRDCVRPQTTMGNGVSGSPCSKHCGGVRDACEQQEIAKMVPCRFAPQLKRMRPTGCRMGSQRLR